MKIRTWIPLFLALLAPGVYGWYQYFAFAQPQRAEIVALLPVLDAAAEVEGDLGAGCAAVDRLQPILQDAANGGSGTQAREIFETVLSNVEETRARCRKDGRSLELHVQLDRLADRLRPLRGGPWYAGRQSGAARLSLFVALPAELFALLVILRYRRRYRRLYADATDATDATAT